MKKPKKASKTPSSFKSKNCSLLKILSEPDTAKNLESIYQRVIDTVSENPRDSFGTIEESIDIKVRFLKGTSSKEIRVDVNIVTNLEYSANTERYYNLVNVQKNNSARIHRR